MGWLITLRHVLVALLLVLGGWLMAECVVLIQQVRAVVASLPGTMDAAIKRFGDGLQQLKRELKDVQAAIASGE